jgi:hypothetical protein
MISKPKMAYDFIILFFSPYNDRVLFILTHSCDSGGSFDFGF